MGVLPTVQWVRPADAVQGQESGWKLTLQADVQILQTDENSGRSCLIPETIRSHLTLVLDPITL